MENKAGARALRDRDRQDLTTGHITQKILFFAIPTILGNLFQQLYNVVDTLIVGNFAANSTECIAAVNSSFPIMMFFSSLFMGVSMGANIIVSQYKGAKDHENMEKAMTTTFTLSMLVGVLITVLGLVFTPPLLRLLGTPENIMEGSATYLRIVFIGTCGNIVYNGMNGLIRGLGDAKTPMYALIIAAILNIVLDLVFVACFHWDVAGVAWATIIAHIASGLLLLWWQNKGVYGAKINFRNLKPDKKISGMIVRLGLPAAIQNAAFASGMLVTQGFANRFGSNYIAANGIIMKVDGFAMMPMMGLQAAITTYVGQNIGAGDIKRTNDGIRSTCIMAVCFSVILGFILYFFGKYLMAAFNVNEEALAMGVRGLRFLCFFYVFMAIQNVLGGALRGAGASTASAVVGVVTTAVRLPLGYLLAILPLNRACQAAVDAGLYATRELAEKAGVGMEHYFGMFQCFGFGMVLGLFVLLPIYIWGNWRSKGITDKAKMATGRGPRPAG
ncbi:MAG: MATE family efflux transporter [Oscillospiraceae bacterium]|nr:MATE family efflux transporter [Oscillospiraceae bacterium]